MPERYFLDKLGVKTIRLQGLSGGGHIQIGREVLATQGIVPADEADVYSQMFRLGYARIVEHQDGLVQVEHTCKLTGPQTQFLKSLEHSGKHIKFVNARR